MIVFDIDGTLSIVGDRLKCLKEKDWDNFYARHDDGDIIKSIDLNQKRFGYSDEWNMVFKNTIYQLKLEDR